MATNTYSGSGGTRQEDAKQKANETKEQAKQQAGELADQAKQQASSQLASQKERASSSLNSVSKALHQASDKLRDEDEGGIAGYVDDAANQVEQFARSLQDKSVGELVDGAKHYARQEPALFLGGAMLLGLFGSRFLKSSSPDAYRSSGRGDRYYGGGRPYRGSSYRGGSEERYGEGSRGLPEGQRSRVYTPTEVGTSAGTGATAGVGGGTATASGGGTLTPSGGPATAETRRGEDKDNG